MSNSQGFLRKAQDLLARNPDATDVVMLVRSEQGFSLLTLDHESEMTDEQRQELIHMLQAVCIALTISDEDDLDLDDGADEDGDDWEDEPGVLPANYPEDDLDRTPRH